MKERILGASVLVVFVVLVVPIFLDGSPGSSETVTQRVLLPGQEEQDTKTVVLEREREVPIPAAVRRQEAAVERASPDTPELAEPTGENAVEASDQEPQMTSSEPDNDVQREETTPPPQVPQSASAEVSAAAESSTGMWAVQLGSFSNKANAEALAADLRKQGYAAFLSQLDQSGTALHRVRIGPQKDRTGAEAMAERLSRVGQKGQVVPHP